MIVKIKLDKPIKFSLCNNQIIRTKVSTSDIFALWTNSSFPPSLTVKLFGRGIPATCQEKHETVPTDKHIVRLRCVP